MTKKQKIVYIYFIILPFIDLITSLLTRFSNFNVSLGMIVKGFTLIYCLIHVLFFSKSKYRKKSIIYLFILFIFGIIYLLGKYDCFSLSNILNEVTYAFRYFYFPIMLIGLFNLFDDFDIDNRLIKKIFFINCITYTLLFLVPYFTNTSFSSYRYSSVNGENGWFYAANETGVIMLMLLTSVSYFMNNHKRWYLILIFPILLSIVFIGTKVSYFGLIITILLISIFYIIINNKNDKFSNNLFTSFGLLIVLIISCSFSVTIDNIEGRVDFINSNKNVVSDVNNSTKKYKYNDINDLIDNENAATFVTVLLNGRADFVLVNYSVYSEAPFFDKLFGLGWNNRDSINYDVNKKLMEIDYLDIFIHYGIFGFIVYFMPLLYLIYKFFKYIKRINKHSLFYIIISMLILGISSFAGHVLAAPAVSIYLVLTIYLGVYYYNYNDKTNENEITVLALHLNYGGIEQYISSLCKMLEDDYKINIICTYKILDNPAFKFSNKINISYLINNRPYKQEFKDAIKSKNLVKIFKFGFINLWLIILKYFRNIESVMYIRSKYIITTRSFHNNLVGIFGNSNIIKIATEHNYHNDDKSYVNKVLKSIKYFDYFVVVSENLKNYYKDKIGNTKCIYIPNVIDNLPEHFSKYSENSIVSVGRLEYEKGQKDLIDVIYSLKDDIKNIKLYLIGDGSLRNDLEKLVKDYKLEDNVVFTGFISKKEMEKYFLKSKLFVLTSYTESFGLVLLEAMSYKLPCLAYDSADGAKELLKNNVGVLVKNRNKDVMCKNIIELFNNKSKLLLYGDKGYSRCNDFLISNVKKEWLKLLECDYDD